jgi:hypothetical protein
MTDREIDVLQFRLREALHAVKWAQNYILAHPNCIEKQYDRDYFLHRLGRILSRGKGAADVESGTGSVGSTETP